MKYTIQVISAHGPCILNDGVPMTPEEIVNTLNKIDFSEDALKMSYRYMKGDTRIGSEELTNKLCDSICNLIGDDEFCNWLESFKE